MELGVPQRWRLAISSESCWPSIRQMPIQQIKPGAESYGAAMAACDNAQQWTQVAQLYARLISFRNIACAPKAHGS